MHAGEKPRRGCTATCRGQRARRCSDSAISGAVAGLEVITPSNLPNGLVFSASFWRRGAPPRFVSNHAAGAPRLHPTFESKSRLDLKGRWYPTAANPRSGNIAHGRPQLHHLSFHDEIPSRLSSRAPARMRRTRPRGRRGRWHRFGRAADGGDPLGACALPPPAGTRSSRSATPAPPRCTRAHERRAR